MTQPAASMYFSLFDRTLSLLASTVVLSCPYLLPLCVLFPLFSLVVRDSMSARTMINQVSPS